IITGDIVNSTLLKKPEEKKLLSTLSSVLKPYQYMFYRGDSFQAYIAEPKDALKIVLQMRAAAKRLSSESSLPVADIRASIGIGNVVKPVRNLETAAGEAFILSGRTFDEMSKSGKRLVIQSNNDSINLGLKIVANYADSLFALLTSKQAAVLFELLMERNQKETAKALKKSQPTINKHAQSAKWPEINNLIEDYKLFINQL
ncbi:MAG: hypothetical protein ACRDE5_09315, partial [Ginsengibacter sp.]